MRAAYICADSGVPVFGRKGCSIHVQEVIRALRRRGVTIDLFAARFDGAAPADLASVRTHPLPLPRKGDWPEREEAAVAANHDLAQALRREGPFDFVYERHSLWSFAGMEYGAATAVPGLLEVNAPLISEQINHRRLANRALAEDIARRSFTSASASLAVSNDLVGYLWQFGCAPDRIFVVPNGVDTRRFAPGLGPIFRPDPGSFTIGFVGTLKPWHGLDVLGNAFTLLHKEEPRTRLLVVGDGPERERFAQQLFAGGLSNAIRFAGSVDPADMPRWLASMDVAVAPYPDLDQFYFSPLKIYEYMAAGLPVVASGIGQVQTIIAQDATGLLCRPGDAADLARALRRLKDDRTLRQRLGIAAREKVERHHTWEGVADRILKVATTCRSLTPG